MTNQPTVDQENVSATLTVAVPTAKVFAVLADPTTHSAIDGTGWVQEAADRNSQDLWIGVPRSSSPAVSLTTLTLATVLAVVKP